MRKKAFLISVSSLATIALAGTSLASSFDLSALPEPGKFETSVAERGYRRSKNPRSLQATWRTLKMSSDPSAPHVMEMTDARQRILVAVCTLAHRTWEARRRNTGLILNFSGSSAMEFA
jgi:hypothetical protein